MPAVFVHVYGAFFPSWNVTLKATHLSCHVYVSHQDLRTESRPLTEHPKHDGMLGSLWDYLAEAEMATNPKMQSIYFSVVNSSTMFEKEELGRAVVEVSTLDQGKWKELWVPLQGLMDGAQLGLRLLPEGCGIERTSRVKPKKQVEAFLFSIPKRQLLARNNSAACTLVIVAACLSTAHAALIIAPRLYDGKGFSIEVAAGELSASPGTWKLPVEPTYTTPTKQLLALTKARQERRNHRDIEKQHVQGDIQDRVQQFLNIIRHYEEELESWSPRHYREEAWALQIYIEHLHQVSQEVAATIVQWEKKWEEEEGMLQVTLHEMTAQRTAAAVQIYNRNRARVNAAKRAAEESRVVPEELTRPSLAAHVDYLAFRNAMSIVDNELEEDLAKQMSKHGHRSTSPSTDMTPHVLSLGAPQRRSTLSAAEIRLLRGAQRKVVSVMQRKVSRYLARTRGIQRDQFDSLYAVYEQMRLMSSGEGAQHGMGGAHPAEVGPLNTHDVPHITTTAESGEREAGGRASRAASPASLRTSRRPPSESAELGTQLEVGIGALFSGMSCQGDPQYVAWAEVVELAQTLFPDLLQERLDRVLAPYGLQTESVATLSLFAPNAKMPEGYPNWFTFANAFFPSKARGSWGSDPGSVLWCTPSSASFTPQRCAPQAVFRLVVVELLNLRKRVLAPVVVPTLQSALETEARLKDWREQAQALLQAKQEEVDAAEAEKLKFREEILASEDVIRKSDAEKNRLGAQMACFERQAKVLQKNLASMRLSYVSAEEELRPSVEEHILLDRHRAHQLRCSTPASPRSPRHAGLPNGQQQALADNSLCLCGSPHASPRRSPAPAPAASAAAAAAASPQGGTQQQTNTLPLLWVLAAQHYIYNEVLRGLLRSPGMHAATTEGIRKRLESRKLYDAFRVFADEAAAAEGLTAAAAVAAAAAAPPPPPLSPVSLRRLAFDLQARRPAPGEGYLPLRGGIAAAVLAACCAARAAASAWAFRHAEGIFLQRRAGVPSGGAASPVPPQCVRVDRALLQRATDQLHRSTARRQGRGDPQRPRPQSSRASAASGGPPAAPRRAGAEEAVPANPHTQKYRSFARPLPPSPADAARSLMEKAQMRRRGRYTAFQMERWVHADAGAV